MKLLTHQVVIIHHLLIQIQLILQTLLQTIILIQEEQIVLIMLLQAIQETIQEIEQLLKILLHQLIIESNAICLKYLIFEETICYNIFEGDKLCHFNMKH